MPTKKTTKKTATTKRSNTTSKKTAAQKKTPVKKSAARKKTASPARKTTRAKRIAVTAPPAQAFWVCDGTMLHSITDLAAALPELSPDVFAHHVDAEKNDFANWIEQVLGDATAATALRKAKTQAAAVKAIHTQLKQYTQ